MTWHAVEAVDDAVAATRRFLFPFSVVRWAKLALLVLFMSVGVNTNVGVPPLPSVETTTVGAGDIVSLAAELGVEASTLVAIGVGVAIVSAAFTIVALTLRLVFYDALRTNEVRLWTPFTRRFRQAVGLFVFSVGVGFAFVAPIVAGAVAHERGLVAIGDLPGAALVASVALAVALVVIGLLVARFTYEFAVPVMVGQDVGVLAAWRRLWPTVRESWLGFLVYLVIHFFLGLALSIAEGVVLLFVGGVAVVLGALALLVVGGLLGGLGALTATTAGTVVIVVVVALALVAVVAVLLPVRIATRTYLIAYEVSTLGGIDPELAMLSPGIDPPTEPTNARGDDPDDAHGRNDEAS